MVTVAKTLLMPAKANPNTKSTRMMAFLPGFKKGILFILHFLGGRTSKQHCEPTPVAASKPVHGCKFNVGALASIRRAAVMSAINSTLH
jgi:F420-0:gamma-glutamyl ligase-like protein